MTWPRLLREWRQALKLDPEHKACKADYKQAKKLSKIMVKIEEIMGKEVRLAVSPWALQ